MDRQKGTEPGVTRRTSREPRRQDETEVLRWRFGPSEDSPAIARRLVADVLAEDTELEVVQLLVSELVTNVIMHTGKPGELRVSILPDTVRVEVHDTGSRPARPRSRAGPDGGFGLRIVAAMSRDWGSAPVPDARGKAVWFEVPRRAAGGGRPCGPRGRRGRGAGMRGTNTLVSG
jgi:hypothetical protein